ncbi:MAG: M48 family metallopeptidase [Spirochaetales bacterium]
MTAIVACTTAPVTDRRQLALVPVSSLAAQSDELYAQLKDETGIVRGTRNARMVQRIGERVAEAAESYMRENGMEDQIELYDWEFALFDDDEQINAFCMPGGKIGIYTGILPVTDGEAGLATIMGHEVAHAIANHSQERMSQMLVLELGANTLEAALDEQPEQTRNLLLAAYGVGAQVGVLLPYNREQEYEADVIGLVLMAKAGYDPRNAVDLWQRMNDLGGQRPPEFLSTHPHPEERIDRIRENIPTAMEYYRN